MCVVGRRCICNLNEDKFQSSVFLLFKSLFSFVEVDFTGSLLEGSGSRLTPDPSSSNVTS